MPIGGEYLAAYGAPAGTPDVVRTRPQPRPRPASRPTPPTPSPSPWQTLQPSDAVSDDSGFPRVNFGAMYDAAQRGLTEETYNNAADAGFGALRAGPYVASLNQNIGNLQGQMAGKAADLAEAEAGRRTQVGMHTAGLRSQEGISASQLASAERNLQAELGSRASLQQSQLTAEAARQTAQLAAQKLQLGMQLDSNELLALTRMGEEARQYDAGLGQRASEFGADMAYKTQIAEDQAYQNYLAWLFGGSTRLTEPTGRVVPNAVATGGSPSPFAQIASPFMGAMGVGAGMKIFG